MAVQVRREEAEIMRVEKDQQTMTNTVVKASEFEKRRRTMEKENRNKFKQMQSDRNDKLEQISLKKKLERQKAVQKARQLVRRDNEMTEKIEKMRADMKANIEEQHEIR